MRTEFHVHTKASKDSLMGKYALLAMCKIKRIDCLAITDHNEIDGALLLQPFLRNYGIDVIVGEEIFSKDGEIIGLYLSQKIPAGLSAEDTVDRIKKQSGVVYIPHPYDDKRSKTVLKPEALKRIADRVDCMEIHNGRNSDRSYSVKQKEICESYGFTPVIGGDSHCFIEVGRNYCSTIAPFERTLFIDTLVNAAFHRSDCLQVAHIITKFVKVIKMMQRGDLNGLRRAFNRRSR